MAVPERKATGSEKRALRKKANGNGFGEAIADQQSTAVPIEYLPELKEVMDGLAHEYREIADQIKLLDDRRKDLLEVIMGLVRESGVDSITGDNYHVVRVIQTRHPLSETKLVELGVDPDTIDKAKGTVVTDYVQVRAYVPPGN